MSGTERRIDEYLVSQGIKRKTKGFVILEIAIGMILDNPYMNCQELFIEIASINKLPSADWHKAYNNAYTAINTSQAKGKSVNAFIRSAAAVCTKKV